MKELTWEMLESLFSMDLDTLTTEDLQELKDKHEGKDEWHSYEVLGCVNFIELLIKQRDDYKDKLDGYSKVPLKQHETERDRYKAALEDIRDHEAEILDQGKCGYDMWVHETSQQALAGK